MLFKWKMALNMDEGATLAAQVITVSAKRLFTMISKRNLMISPGKDQSKSVQHQIEVVTSKTVNSVAHALFKPTAIPNSFNTLEKMFVKAHARPSKGGIEREPQSQTIPLIAATPTKVAPKLATKGRKRKESEIDEDDFQLTSADLSPIPSPPKKPVGRPPKVQFPPAPPSPSHSSSSTPRAPAIDEEMLVENLAGRMEREMAKWRTTALSNSALEHELKIAQENADKFEALSIEQQNQVLVNLILISFL